MSWFSKETYFFLGLQIFLPRVTERLDRIPKDPSADPEDQANVPKVHSPPPSKATPPEEQVLRQGVERDPAAQQCLKGPQMGKSQRAHKMQRWGQGGKNFCQAHPGSLAQFFKQLWEQGCHTPLILLRVKVAGAFISPYISALAKGLAGATHVSRYFCHPAQA